MELSITYMRIGTEATVVRFLGRNCAFQRRLRTMGLREGKRLKMVAIHPFSGPVVIEVDGREITLGRGIAQKVMVVL